MAGNIFLDSAEMSVSETAGTVVERIDRTGSTDGVVTITYGLTNDSAVSGLNFVGGTFTATMAAGADHVDVPITILNDHVADPTQSFIMSVINADGATLVAPRTSRVSIIDAENPAPPPPPVAAPVSNYDVIQVPVVNGLDQPIRFVISPLDGNQAYVAEKPGVIMLANLTTGATSTVLDIQSMVNDHQDRGLLDIALDPNFSHNGFIYAFVIVDPPNTAGQAGAAGPDGSGNRYAQVVRFTADAATHFTTVVPGSMKVLLGGNGHTLQDISGNGTLDFTDPAYASNLASDHVLNPANPVPVINGIKQDFIKADSSSHDGGHLAFGPDGALYVSIGDATSFNYADPHASDVQNLDALSGKILRIDAATGLGLADNPFVQAGESLSDNRAKVYQLGLRNPFSMTFDTEGKLLISDTGWNTWEEINTGGPGANFGWPFYEGGQNGTSLQTDTWRDTPAAKAFYAQVAAGTIHITAPYVALPHDTSLPGFHDQAITAGEAVLHGALYPTALQGGFLFTDFSNDRVYSVNIDNSSDVQFLFNGSGPYAPVDFVNGADGYVYYADLITGQIGKLQIETLDHTPVTEPTIGAGKDYLVLRVSQDPYQGLAHYTLAVDGKAVGGIIAAHAVHDAAADADIITVRGDWGTGPHTVTVNFLNDAWGGGPTTDRNLHVESVTYDGQAVAGSTQELQVNGPVDIAFTGVPGPAPITTVLGTGTDTLMVTLSEEAWKGDAQYTVSVDGVAMSGVLKAGAFHSSGQSDTVVLKGNWAAGPHEVAVNFLNDGYGGATDMDRNLHVDGITYNGQAVANGSADLLSGGIKDFAFTDTGAPAPKDSVVGAPANSVTVRISQDAWNGDAQYVLTVDGKQQGGVQTASAWHSVGQADTVTAVGDWGAGPHHLGVTFLNDAFGGTPAMDRNLYVEGVTGDGVQVPHAFTALYSPGTAVFDFV